MLALVKYFTVTSLFMFSVSMNAADNNKNKSNKPAPLPCAHLNISDLNTMGGVGIVNSNLLSKEDAQKLAKEKADEATGLAQEISFINTYYNKRGIHTIAISTTNQTPLRACPELSCDFTACNPAWLCSDANERASLISVSARSTSLKSQFDYLTKNVEELLGYLISSDVTINERFMKLVDNDTGAAMNMIDNNVDKIGQLDKFLHIEGFCFADNDTLFGKYRFDEDFISPALQNKHTLVGEGIAENRVATGLISDKIMLSIKRALIDLAKQLKVQVDASVDIQQSDTGLFLLTDTSNTGRVIVQAKLLSLNVVPGDKGFNIKSSVVPVKALAD